MKSTITFNFFNNFNNGKFMFTPSVLFGKEQAQHDFLYWQFHEKGGRKALRKGDWILLNYTVFDLAKTTVELYTIASDPGEQNNVATQHPEIVKELSEMMTGVRTPSEIFTFQSPTLIK